MHAIQDWSVSTLALPPSFSSGFGGRVGLSAAKQSLTLSYISLIVALRSDQQETTPGWRTGNDRPNDHSTSLRSRRALAERAVDDAQAVVILTRRTTGPAKPG